MLQSLLAVFSYKTISIMGKIIHAINAVVLAWGVLGHDVVGNLLKNFAFAFALAVSDVEHVTLRLDDFGIIEVFATKLVAIRTRMMVVNAVIRQLVVFLINVSG